MGHGHPHHHPATVSRKLVIAAAVTGSFVVVELVAGLFAGSLALIGDALHNFTDALSLIIALVAVRLAQRPPNDVKSFGYQRAGILAAFINAGTLVAFTLYLIIEAVDRFRHPHEAVVARYAARRIRLHRTDREGALRVVLPALASPARVEPLVRTVRYWSERRTR